jgi:hypothetical protein
VATATIAEWYRYRFGADQSRGPVKGGYTITEIDHKRPSVAGIRCRELVMLTIWN